MKMSSEAITALKALVDAAQTTEISDAQKIRTMMKETGHEEPLLNRLPNGQFSLIYDYNTFHFGKDEKIKPYLR